MTESRNIRPAASGRIQRLALSCAMISIHTSEAFSLTRHSAFMPRSAIRSAHSPSRLFIFAPPGSGYARREDEKSELPDSYEPMMEFPGTMRPGRTPENSPFHDLPIADTDPDPVPWPHFQQIEWHHQWAPPHPHPIPMEEFIEQQGRWATPEMEAAMRAGVRRDVRQRQEIEEEQKRETLIMDDDDDDETDDEPQDLGEGMFGQLGSDADQALTAEAVAPPVEGAEVIVDEEEGTEEVTEEEGGSFDDFLLDLGLDGDDEEEDVDDNDVVEEDDKPMVASKQKPKPAPAPVPVPEPVVEAPPRKAAPRARLEDVVESDDEGDEEDDDIETNESETSGGATASINVDDDDDLDLGLDDDDDEITGNDGVSTVPLEDFSDGDDLGTDDFFNDGGFDYDGGDIGSDGGDNW